MLCATCRRQVAPATVCAGCGTPALGASQALGIVLADGTCVPILGDMTIGRAPGSTLCLDDPSVSRSHARILVGDGGAMLEDAGSSYGTLLDGVAVTAPTPLRAGGEITVGDLKLGLRALDDTSAAGKTVVVPVGASLVLGAVGGASVHSAGVPEARRPRLRSGYALKRLEASEGDQRWVLRDLHDGNFRRLGEQDAELLQLLDGARTLHELLAEAERRQGAAGIARLMRLLTDLGERGLLADVAGSRPAAPEPVGWRRVVRTREHVVPGFGDFISRLYRRGGWVLFTRPAAIAICALGVAGVAVAVALVVKRYGTPFVVAERLVLGGLVFLVGRVLLAAVHELAHGLALESVGRRVSRGGFKLVFVFPYAFVDTSEVWFEPRRRRMLVTIAGPLADFAVAGVFAILCLVLEPGTIRDVTFQVAFAGYVAALFNLNPFLDRDGYHLVADRLGIPGLRAQARARLRRRLAGLPQQTEPALTRFAFAGLAWSIVMVAIVVFFSLRYRPLLEHYVSETVLWVVLGSVWAGALVPVLITLAPPLLARLRGRGAEFEPTA